jgi:Ser/Thr protein kinase RdoA (MazF antagonist)
MRGYAGELPVLNPAGDDLDRALAYAVGEQLLTDADASARTERRDELRARLLGLAPDRQDLLGDAFPRNSLVTRHGVVWIDFEDCCSGPAIWDLAVLARRDPDPVIIAAIRDRHGDEALQTAIALREIQADVWTLIHDARLARGW